MFRKEKDLEERAQRRAVLNDSSTILAATMSNEFIFHELMKMSRKAEVAASAEESGATSVYKPATEPFMSPVHYPPASGAGPSIKPSFEPKQFRRRMKNLRGTPKDQGMWTLPSAHTTQGLMLVLPTDISLFDQVFERWCSVTLNHVNEKPWPDN